VLPCVPYLRRLSIWSSLVVAAAAVLTTVVAVLVGIAHRYRAQLLVVVRQPKHLWRLVVVWFTRLRLAAVEQASVVATVQTVLSQAQVWRRLLQQVAVAVRQAQTVRLAVLVAVLLVVLAEVGQVVLVKRIRVSRVAITLATLRVLVVVVLVWLAQMWLLWLLATVATVLHQASQVHQSLGLVAVAVGFVAVNLVAQGVQVAVVTVLKAVLLTLARWTQVQAAVVAVLLAVAAAKVSSSFVTLTMFLLVQ